MNALKRALLKNLVRPNWLAAMLVALSATLSAARADPPPIIGPANLLTYNDVTAESGDLYVDSPDLVFPSNTSIGPNDPLEVVLNFAAPITLTLDPDYIHHYRTMAYTFQDGAYLEGVVPDDAREDSPNGELSGSLEYNGSVVLPLPIAIGPLDQHFVDWSVYTVDVPFGPPTTITFNSAYFVFTEDENVTAYGSEIYVDGYVPDTASTFTMLGLGIVAIVGVKGRVGSVGLRILRHRSLRQHSL